MTICTQTITANIHYYMFIIRGLLVHVHEADVQLERQVSVIAVELMCSYMQSTCTYMRSQKCGQHLCPINYQPVPQLGYRHDIKISRIPRHDGIKCTLNAGSMPWYVCHYDIRVISPRRGIKHCRSQSKMALKFLALAPIDSHSNLLGI